MLIDFSTITNIIPKDGRLIMTFTKKMTEKTETEEEKVNEINVVFAQLFKDKENDNDFSPVIISGTIDELNEGFESMVTDIGQDQEKLAQLKASPVSRVAAKKKQLSSAIQKASKTAAPANKNEDGKKEEPKKKPEPPKPQMVDLFAGLTNTPTPPPPTATVNPPPEPVVEEVVVEEPEENAPEITAGGEE